MDGYHATHTWESETSLSQTLFEALAAASERDATELEPLSSVVDPDALDTLFKPVDGSALRNGDGHVAFPFDGHRVTVTSRGDITVRRDSTDAPRGNVTDESEFQSALTQLIRDAEANGVDIEGGWVCQTESEWGTEIFQIVRPNSDR